MINFKLTRCEGSMCRRQRNSHREVKEESNFQLVPQNLEVDEPDGGDSESQKKMPFMTTWGPVGFVKKLHPLSIMVTLTIQKLYQDLS